MEEKKPTVLMALEIIMKYSSPVHRLSKKDISSYIRRDYGVVPDRKTVSAALEHLAESSLGIGYSAVRHAGKETKTDWYRKEKISSENLKLIGYSLVCAQAAGKERIGSAEKEMAEYGMEAPEWRKMTVASGGDDKIYESTVFNLELTGNAWAQRRMIRFSLLSYRRSDGKSVYFCDPAGKVIRYLVKPVSIRMKKNRPYLYGEIGDTGHFRYFPVDRMESVEISDISFESQTRNVYTVSKTSEKKPSGKYVILVKKEIAGEAYDSFGSQNTEVVCEYSGTCEISLTAEFREVLHFILSHGSDAELISPTKYRRIVAKELKSAYGKYLTLKKYTGYLS